jgi:lipopolysaccharide/colanic/teichoic acid biosynthesis glycosyltransferase
MGTRALQVRQHASGGGEKLQYDLFYIENASLDMLIMFQTIKIVLLGRGTQ